MQSAEEIILQQMALLHETTKACGHTMFACIAELSKAMAELARVIPSVRQNSACEKSQSVYADFSILPSVTLKASDITELLEVRKEKSQQALSEFQQILNEYQKS